MCKKYSSAYLVSLRSLKISISSMKLKVFIQLCLLFFPLTYVSAQEIIGADTAKLDIFGDTEDGFSLINDMPLTVNMEREMELSEEAKDARKEKEKKRKKKVFYGLKTKKGFTRRGYGDKVELEIFYYLKEAPETDPYVPEIYWYDFTRKRIRNTGEIEGKRGVVLHGPYKRIVGEQIVEEGIYYKGTKQGRWTKYNAQDVLVDKQKYYRGWPKDSKVRYYDEKLTLLKEVVPIVYGKKEGMYYYFHENGTVAIRGEYKEDVKVGKWTEYYPFLRRRKKEIQYPADPYDKGYQPFISKEWDRSNRLVYERKN